MLTADLRWSVRAAYEQRLQRNEEIQEEKQRRRERLAELREKRRMAKFLYGTPPF